MPTEHDERLERLDIGRSLSSPPPPVHPFRFIIRHSCQHLPRGTHVSLGPGPPAPSPPTSLDAAPWSASRISLVRATTVTEGTERTAAEQNFDGAHLSRLGTL